MLHYYLHLFGNNLRSAKAAQDTVHNQFSQFEQYLRNSITALKKKEVQARWEKVEEKNIAELTIIGNIYELPKTTTIAVQNTPKGYYRIKIIKDSPNFAKKIEYKIGDIEDEASISEDDFQNGLVHLPGVETLSFDALRWGFADIELTPAWHLLQTGETLRDGRTNHTIISCSGDEITVTGALTGNERLIYGETEIVYTVKRTSGTPPEETSILYEDARAAVFYAMGNITGVERCNNRLPEFIDRSRIYFKDEPQRLLEYEIPENSKPTTIVLHDAANYDKEVISNNNIHLRVVRPLQNNPIRWKIQLKKMNVEADFDDEQNTLSPLRYFFDKNVSIVDGLKNKYKIDANASDGDEYQIVLCRASTGEERKRRIYCYPEGEILRVRVDTRPIKRQFAAVSLLRQMPLFAHKALISLFDDKEKTQWKNPENKITVAPWFVLDEGRSGCTEQRNFVQKALNTFDFALLEGPPGSGKTTVILELICQLISRGKRVLLCGSTNVAIDNVLERIIEKKDGCQPLLEQVPILPVRIGRAERVDQNIVAYQIDRLLENVPEDEREWRRTLLLEAANLVCGTTTGILNHPKFREQEGRVESYTRADGSIGYRYAGETPVTPEFDYLIIDECSKTTFQEFLVPALYAKRWILAGDVKQLSPFTEPENVECNFEHMTLWDNNEKKTEEIDSNVFNAVFCLYKLHDCLKYQGNRFVLPVNSALLDCIITELERGRIDRFHEYTIFIAVFRTERKSVLPNVLVKRPDEINYLELAAANCILLDSEFLDGLVDFIPASFAVLKMPEWESRIHAFYHNAFLRNNSFKYYTRGQKEPLENSFEIVRVLNDDFKERNWAKEIAWRCNSEHQLRLTNNQRKENLKKQIDDLTPFALDKTRFEEARDLIVELSFPSILEALVTGIKGRKSRKKSTITEGFNTDDLELRKTTLTYQHRMHPDISTFPRTQFYGGKDALLDLELPRHIKDSRNWGYMEYKTRNVWVNVRSPTRGTRNIFEVEAMMRHLKKFLDYATRNPQPEGKNWEVACLAFYRGQEKLIREGGFIKGEEKIEGLQALTGKLKAQSNFDYNKDKTLGQYPVYIRLHSVDRFQGHEADVVFLSMSQTHKDGFLDNPNRLNVSVTRAKFQLVVFGSYDYFSQKSRSHDLRSLALSMERI